mmetsp:Transcript_35981/g.84000  ORF Transcript_35981/g.84000 Transcript_35981/m.84000 type:complete len:190 (-) Transcript_35981:88-657(-)
MSEPVADMYCRAEILASRAVSSPSSLFSILRMPAWALTWPGGQLSGIGRNSSFVKNIERYERVFNKGTIWGKEDSCSGNEEPPKFFVDVVPLDQQKKESTLESTLFRIVGKAIDATMMINDKKLLHRSCCSNDVLVRRQISSYVKQSHNCVRNAGREDGAARKIATHYPTNMEVVLLEKYFTMNKESGL